MTASRAGVLVAAMTCAWPSAYGAGLCNTAWDGDKIGRSLTDKQDKSTVVTAAQVRAFQEAKERISRTAGLSPSMLICSSSAPNAFATRGKDGKELVGVTVGMLKF